MEFPREFRMNGWPGRWGTLLFWFLLSIAAFFFVLGWVAGNDLKGWREAIFVGAWMLSWQACIPFLFILNRLSTKVFLSGSLMVVVRPLSRATFELRHSFAHVIEHESFWALRVVCERRFRDIPRNLEDIDDLQAAILHHAKRVSRNEALEMEAQLHPPRRWYIYGWAPGAFIILVAFLFRRFIETGGTWLIFFWIGVVVMVATIPTVWWLGRKKQKEIRAMKDSPDCFSSPVDHA